MGPPGVEGERGVAGSPGTGTVGEKGMRGDPGLRETVGEPGLQGTPAGGAVYTHWGRTTCPTVQGTHLLYSGRAGGSPNQHKGGAANYMCLPNDPDHLQYQSGVQRNGHIGGVEYWSDKNPESVPGLNSGSNPAAYFYLVEPLCNGLSCALYDDEKELTCVVCTR